MKHLFLLPILFFILVQTTQSQSVAWELSGESGSQTSSNSTFQTANFAVGALTRGPGLVAASGAGSINASGWFDGSSATTLQNAIANNDYYEFTVSRLNCHFINSDSFHIVLRSSATGPNTVTLRSSVDNFGSNLETRPVTTTSTRISFYDDIFMEADSVTTFRLYGYGGAAGGGSPAAGGTMRIGSSTTPSDNDLVVFGSANPFLMIQPTNVITNAFTTVQQNPLNANVFSEVSWTRTPEPIGLADLSGLGIVPQFIAMNNTGAPLTSAFTAQATWGSCVTPPVTFAYIINPPPPSVPCPNSIEAWDLSAEPGDQISSDAFFSGTGIGTGVLTRGAGITPNPTIGSIAGSGWYDSNTTTTIDDAIAGNKYYEFTLPIDANTTASPTLVRAIMTGNPGSPRNLALRSSADNFSTTIASSTLTTSPALKTLDFATITQTRGTLTFRLYAFGPPINANFAPNPTAGVRIGNSSPPESSDLCIIGTTSTASATCAVTGITLSQIEPCQNNGTPNDLNDDFYFADINYTFVNPPTTGFFQISGTAIGNPNQNFLASSVAAGGSPFTLNNRQISVNGGTLTASFLDAAGCSLSVNIVPVPPCPSLGDEFSVLDVDFTNQAPCNNNNTPSNPNDDFYTVDVTVQYENFIPGGTLTLLGDGLSGPGPSVAANSGTIFTHTFTNVKIKANGNVPEILAQICVPDESTSDPNDDACAALAANAPTVPSCSSGNTSANLTCPPNITVNCDEVPDPDPDDVTTTAFCDDGIDFTFVGDVISNQTCPGTYLITRTYSASGGCISLSFCTQQIQVQDVVAPSLTCPSGISVTCANQVPPPNISSVTNVNDNCYGTMSVVMFVGDAISNQTCANRLTITRTYSATDGCSNTATCSQVITVNDQTGPTLTCPASQTVSCATAVPAENINSVTNVSDNCGAGATVTVLSNNISNQTCANRFTVFRIYQATDACGNSAVCSQVITVNDQTPPSLTCPANQTVSCASAVPAANTASVTNVSDNCGGGATVTLVSSTTSNQTCADRFSVTRTYRATDACGNSATCSQVITVNDQTAPSLTCPTSQTVSCANEVPAANIASVTNVSDGCGGGVTVTLVSNTMSNQTCANRFTVTRTYRATDACGNSATCSQVITVNDQTGPTFTSVPANVTVDCYLIPSIGVATATDGCGGATVAFLGEVKAAGTCPVIFTLTRTWVATDICGNTSSASQVVRVTDTQAPNILTAPEDVTAECHPGSMDELQTWLDTQGGAIAQDCSPFTWSFGDTPLITCPSTCGNTFQKYIRFTATDQCGNSAFRDARFIVIDTKPPVFSQAPADETFVCMPDCDGTVAFDQWLEKQSEAVVVDDCGNATLTVDKYDEEVGCGNTWAKTYRFRATDQCGNTATKYARFAVIDNTPPVVACQPGGAVWLDCANDLPAPDPSLISAQDECGGTVVSFVEKWSVHSGCPGSMMTVIHRYRATDECGNSTPCEQVFYVEMPEIALFHHPDTVKVACLSDIPSASSILSALKSNAISDCGLVSSVLLLSDSGEPQGGATHRSFQYRLRNFPCGTWSNTMRVTYLATGACKPLCTAGADEWGMANELIGSIKIATAIDSICNRWGAITVGTTARSAGIAGSECFAALMGSNGDCSTLPPGHSQATLTNGCSLAAALLSANGTLRSDLLRNIFALQLNLHYNQYFNQRDLGIQDLKGLPDCVLEEQIMKDLGQQTTWQDFLNLCNRFVAESTAYPYPVGYEGKLLSMLSYLNGLHEGCSLDLPCQDAPSGQIASRDKAGSSTSEDLRLIPNPLYGDRLRLLFNSPVACTGTLIIHSMGGHNVHTQKVLCEAGQNDVQVDLNGIPAGTYIVSITHTQGTKSSFLVNIRL
jgi:hypothetical protein